MTIVVGGMLGGFLVTRGFSSGTTQERQYPTKLSAVVKKPTFTAAVKPNSTYLDSSRSKVRDA